MYGSRGDSRGEDGRCCQACDCATDTCGQRAGNTRGGQGGEGGGQLAVRDTSATGSLWWRAPQTPFLLSSCPSPFVQQVTYQVLLGLIEVLPVVRQHAVVPGRRLLVHAVVHGLARHHAQLQPVAVEGPRAVEHLVPNVRTDMHQFELPLLDLRVRADVGEAAQHELLQPARRAHLLQLRLQVEVPHLHLEPPLQRFERLLVLVGVQLVVLQQAPGVLLAQPHGLQPLQLPHLLVHVLDVLAGVAGGVAVRLGLGAVVRVRVGALGLPLLRPDVDGLLRPPHAEAPPRAADVLVVVVRELRVLQRDPLAPLLPERVQELVHRPRLHDGRAVLQRGALCTHMPDARRPRQRA